MRLNLDAKTKAQQLVKEYLENNASSALAEKINNGTVIEKDGKTLKNKKTLDDFMKYASDKARKLAEKGANSACMEDEVVFGWAVHYFEEDSIEGTLFNEDGTEYKKQPSATAKAPTVKYTPPKPQPKPQMSMFDMFKNEDNSGICATQSDEEPAECACEAAERTLNRARYLPKRKCANLTATMTRACQRFRAFCPITPRKVRQTKCY